MNINYHRLFNLNVAHEYFKDGQDRFMLLDPTVETGRLLQNGKMLFKRLLHGITVLYRAEEDGISPMVELPGNQRFVFALSCTNLPAFLNLTRLDELPSRKYSSGKILYLINSPAATSSNSANPEIIGHSLLDSLRGKLFTYAFRISGNPAVVKFQVTDVAGTPVSVGKDTNGVPFPVTLNLVISSSNEFSVQVDLRSKSSGRYTIAVLDQAGTTTLLQEEIYVDDSLALQQILGVVELVYETGSGHLYGPTEEYRLQFRRASTVWKYFVVNKRSNIDFNSDTITINDNGATTGTPYSINQFSRAYASLKIAADATGPAGNSISLNFSGTDEFPAIIGSGESLSGGKTGVAATGTITIVNNAATGYTISIEGIDFTEGTDFNKGATAKDTANSLRAAINANGSVNVSASLLKYDIQVNDQQALVFQSTQGIPFFETPKTSLQLRKVPGNQILIANLPNPAPGGAIKQISGNSESEVYLYI